MNIKIISKIVLSFFLLSIPLISHGETHINAQNTKFGASWNKAGSPYILDEDVRVEGDYILNISKGVTVMSASTTDGTNYGITLDGAGMNIEGTVDEPVNIISLNNIYSSFGKLINFSNTVFDNVRIDLWQSSTTISSTTIKNSDIGIFTTASNLNIRNSKIINNRIGISSQQFLGNEILTSNNKNTLKNTGGIGNAIDTTVLDPVQNIIKINNSSIVGNSDYGITQESTNIVDARNNWWGNSNGPRDTELGSGDRIYGPTDVNPWIVIDPNIISETPIKTCCSNILFIPGIESSRLYSDSLGILGTSTNQLWEPNRNDDVKKLYLDEKGYSINSNIYTSDIIDSAFGVKSIYKSFIAMMNSVVAEGSINKWLPFPYDWRMSAEKIVRTSDLVNEIEKLARDSKTNKVTIITHSNGGLIAKELMNSLEIKGGGSIVDQIINIAVPELGTPQALLGMLHGNGQSIFGGLIFSEANARSFSQNMPGAYGLLPSRKFFENNPLSVISNLFSSTTISTTSTYDAMKNFILSNSFSKASSTNVSIPLLLNPMLVSISDSIHSLIDMFKPASTTRVLSIFGWGMPTSESIKYEKDKHCNPRTKKLINSVCTNIYTPTLTNSGDGTVLTKANSNNADSTLFFNLKKLEKESKERIDHAGIMESKDILKKIKDNIIQDTSTNNSYDKYFSTTEPIDSDKYLTIKIYSPVDIHIYDREGNHTGIITNPVLGKDLKNYENNIPLSYYGDFGGIKMIRVPYDDDYQILLKGNDSGVFSVDVEITQLDNVIASTTFEEMPVNPEMNAELIISTSTDSFASSSVIYIDKDGDGIAEDEYRGGYHHKEIHKKIRKLHKKKNN